IALSQIISAILASKSSLFPPNSRFINRHIRHKRDKSSTHTGQFSERRRSWWTKRAGWMSRARLTHRKPRRHQRSLGILTGMFLYTDVQDRATLRLTLWHLRIVVMKNRHLRSIPCMSACTIHAVHGDVRKDTAPLRVRDSRRELGLGPQSRHRRVRWS